MQEARHLAQINIARLRYPTDDPRMAEFVGNLDRINAIAERSTGYVWRLKDDSGNAMAIQAFADPLILINMSVWETPDHLAAFVYRTAHARFVQRRGEWFRPLDKPHMALWWIPAGTTPEPQEGVRRLDLLGRHGPTADTFTFAEVTDAAPLVASA